MNPGDRIIHLNHAGASPSTESTLGRVTQHLQLECYAGGYSAAEMVDDERHSVYELVATLIEATASEIALVESATVGFTRLFYSMAQQVENSRTNSDEMRYIIVSEADYAANVVAIYDWINTHSRWGLICLPSQNLSIDASIDGTVSNGRVDLLVLDDILQGRFRHQDTNGNAILLDPSLVALVCIAHIPTNAGIVNPVEAIGTRIFEHNARLLQSGDGDTRMIYYLVDACQSVGQIPVQVQNIRCHGLVATGRKFVRAPRGTGFLYVASSIVDRLTPHHVDHYSTPLEFTSTNVSAASTGSAVHVQKNASRTFTTTPRRGAKRFEFWESSIALKLGLGCAVKELIALGVESIAATVRTLALTLFETLCDIAGASHTHQLRLYHRPECGIVTFWIQNVDSTEVKSRLWNSESSRGPIIRFEVSVVPATSTPNDSDAIGKRDFVRASVSYTTTLGEIDLFCSRIEGMLDDRDMYLMS